MKKLYILTYEHGGYVLWGDRVKPRLKTIFEWLEKYPKLRIGLDYESFTFDEYSKTDPEIIEMISLLLKKYPDRVGLGATTYGQPLSLTISEESNARQLIYAVRTNKAHFGITPNVYSISEFALNNQTPQLIKQCGYDAAILRSHVMGYGYPRTFDSAWGRWIGKDGSEIPAVPTYDKQGRGFNCTTVDNWILSRWPDDTKISLEDFEEMFEKYSPLLASRYDDLTQEIEKVTAYTETKENVEYILLEDIPELYGEAKDELATTDNDFHVQMPWGYCGNEIFNGVRKAEVEAVQAEKLNALAMMLGANEERDNLDEAWKYALVAQHHDVTICGLLDLAHRFIPSSLKASSDAKEKSASAIAAKFASPEKEKTVAINNHSFAIDEWIDYDGKKLHVKLAPFTAEEVEESTEKHCFLWDCESGILTTPCYKLKLTSGGIAYIDSLNGKRIADNGESSLFTACINDEDCASTGEWSVEISNSGALAVYKGKIGSVPFSLEMNFNGESPRIDCKTKFEVHNELIGKLGEKMGLKKSLTVEGHMHESKLCLNLNLCLDENRRMVRDLPYSISDWSGDIRVTEDYWYKEDLILIDQKVSPEVSFKNSTQLNGIYWIALRDGKNGFAVMNRGCMGSAVNGNRVSIPLVYANSYMCGTKMLDGVYDDEFALLPFGAETSDAQLHRNAVSYAYQPTVINVAKGNGELSTLGYADLQTNDGEVILTTLYPENGNLLARFCNYSNEPATAVFKTAVGNVSAETDLLGNETAAVTDGKLTFRPWEIKTIKITL